MKLTAKEQVAEVAKKITPVYTQIVIDLFQDDLEDLLDHEDVTPDDIGAFSYHVGSLLTVFNPEFIKDIDLLRELQAALNEWSKDREFVNRSLGLDPNQ